ncbi:MAG: serine/threonine protein kinase [Haloarculaceae archaeon]
MSEESLDLPAPVREAIADPERGRRRLPALLGLLDDANPTARLGAAWATCRVAIASPELAEYLVRRLEDRLRDDHPPAVAVVFEFVARSYPDVTERELADIDAERAERPPSPVEIDLSRADYFEPGPGDRPVGRTRFPESGPSVGPGRVVSNDPEEPRDRPDRDLDGRDEAVGTDGETGDEATRETDGETGDAAAGTDAATDAGPGAGGPTNAELTRTTERLSSIARRSEFDRLVVLSRRRRDRYGDHYRALGVVDDDEMPVDVTLFHRAGERRRAFEDALADRLAEWQVVSDHANVVGVYDWDRDPHPWVATEYADLTLADRGRLGPSEALWNAERLADALETAHESGIVHAGLDPGNVAYYGNVIDRDERQPPLLSNVGLMAAFRHHFDPTRRLDPRYAAPEYYERKFGRVDHATDIYGLGALVYRLFTGRPPYTGDYETVREAVLTAPPPRPSAVADVPPGIDPVVTKAMATEKLGRYETVTHLATELRDVGGLTNG